MKSWGKEIWDRKQAEQGSLGVIAGTVETKSFFDRQTEKEFNIIEKGVLPLLNKNARILDAGVGPFARFSMEFAKRGYLVTGIDIATRILEIAKKRVDKSGYKVKLLEDDLTNIKKVKEKQDLVFCFGTFGHIPSFLSLTVLKEFNKVLKKGGYAYVHFWINREKRIGNLLHDFIYGIGHYIKIKIGRGYKVNSSFYTEDEIKEMVRLGGFEIVKKNSRGIYLLRKY
jgi:2-polyprenyl-3-methyl-5-hydroxy-6-metoxy-1,4-benzoquinol methylase